MRLSAVIGLLILLATAAVAATQTFTGPFRQTYPTTSTGTVSCIAPTTTTLDCTLSSPLQKNAAAILGPITSGSSQGGGGSGVAPVVTAMNCTVSSGFTNGQTVNRVHGAGACGFSATCLVGGVPSACTGGNIITSWAISAQSCASCYSINSSAVLQGGSNAANVTTEADTVTVTATNSTGTSSGVTQTITAYADGSVTAPSGTAQFPTLFTGGFTYTVRPPWNVAGTDYHVGYPAGTSLADPSLQSNYPIIASGQVTSQTNSGGTVLTFSGGVPAGLWNVMGVYDATTPTAIPNG